jgi:hypothetical protein
MHILHERPWPAIDLVELRFGIAFGSSAEELADFLHRNVEDVRRKWAAEVQREAFPWWLYHAFDHPVFGLCDGCTGNQVGS